MKIHSRIRDIIFIPFGCNIDRIIEKARKLKVKTDIIGRINKSKKLKIKIGVKEFISQDIEFLYEIWDKSFLRIVDEEDI